MIFQQMLPCVGVVRSFRDLPVKLYPVTVYFVSVNYAAESFQLFKLIHNLIAQKQHFLQSAAFIAFRYILKYFYGSLQIKLCFFVVPFFNRSVTYFALI